MVKEKLNNFIDDYSDDEIDIIQIMFIEIEPLAKLKVRNIDKLKLDIKYPKFAKYIKIKQSLNKHYLMLYFVLFYFIIIIFIIGNIYMLLLKYFL